MNIVRIRYIGVRGRTGIQSREQIRVGDKLKKATLLFESTEC